MNTPLEIACTNALAIELSYGQIVSDHVFEDLTQNLDFKPLYFLPIRSRNDNNLTPIIREITSCRESAAFYMFDKPNMKMGYSVLPTNLYQHKKTTYEKDEERPYYDNYLKILNIHNKSVIKSIKLSSKLLHIVEKNIKFKKSKVVIYPNKLIKIADLSKKLDNKSYFMLEVITKLLYFSFESDERWFFSVPTMSIYLLIIRLGFAAYDYFKDVTDLKSLYKACNNFKETSTAPDARFVGNSYKHWIRFLKNIDKIYYKIHKNDIDTLNKAYSYLGIDSLCEDTCNGINTFTEMGKIQKKIKDRFDRIVKNKSNDDLCKEII